MQKEKLNFIFMFLNPGLNNFAMMNTQIIQYQIDLSPGILNQTLKKLDKQLRVHSFLEKSKRGQKGSRGQKRGKGVKGVRVKGSSNLVGGNFSATPSL